MKKLFEIIGFISLLSFTFIYTNKVSMVIKESDEILIKLKEYANKYNVEPIDAYIKDDTIIPGESGKKIDINKSYDKMKIPNQFNENLLVYDIKKPKISYKKYYNKYIIKARKGVGLIFLVNENTNINNILNILNKYNVKATFFIDGNYFINNNNLIINLIKNEHSIGNLGFNKNYNVSGVSFINTLTRTFGKNTFCYLENKNEEVLNICNNNKSYTIIPNIIINDKPLHEIKTKLDKGSIISFNINKETERELPYIIEYIKSKGINIYNIEDLLDE